MGAVAGGAIAVAGRVMFERSLGESLLQILMTIGAELFGSLAQQFLVVRGMRVMTGEAISILNRLMFYLGLRHLLLNVFVAVATEFFGRLA